MIRRTRCYMDNRLTKYPAHDWPVAVMTWTGVRVHICKSCLDEMLDKCDTADVEPTKLEWLIYTDERICLYHGWHPSLCAEYSHKYHVWMDAVPVDEWESARREAWLRIYSVRGHIE